MEHFDCQHGSMVSAVSSCRCLVWLGAGLWQDGTLRWQRPMDHADAELASLAAEAIDLAQETARSARRVARKASALQRMLKDPFGPMQVPPLVGPRLRAACEPSTSKFERLQGHSMLSEGVDLADRSLKLASTGWEWWWALRARQGMPGCS